MAKTQTHHPITNAIVARLRDAGRPAALDALTGIYQGFAPEKASYPFATYNLAAGVYDYLFGDDTTLVAMVDVFVFSRNPVQAEDLDAAISGWLSDQTLSVTGQSTLLCRRVATPPVMPDEDDEGKIVYQWGGTYEVQTDAPPLA
jgi:hypothetical protein